MAGSSGVSFGFPLKHPEKGALANHTQTFPFGSQAGSPGTAPKPAAAAPTPAPATTALEDVQLNFSGQVMTEAGRSCCLGCQS